MSINRNEISGCLRCGGIVGINVDYCTDCEPPPPDLISHPPHYTSHPSGVEHIEITRHMSFNLGNVIKYIWRADLKNDALTDLKKALFYLKDEIAMREESTP